jgi:PAS domain S-box-containing protein
MSLEDSKRAQPSDAPAEMPPLGSGLDSPETEHRQIRGRIRPSTAWLLIAGMWLLPCIVVWLNEILDAPHLLLGAPPTPINWQESIIETAVITIISALAASLLIRDLARRQRAQEALHKSEQRFRILTQHLSHVIYERDRDGKLVYISAAAERLTGYSTEELIANQEKIIPQFILGDAQIEGGKAFRERVLSNGRYRKIGSEMECRTKDGESMWLYNHAFPFYDSDGAVAGFYGILEQITERKQVEHALHESEKMYRLLADNSLDCIWMMDLNLELSYVNPAILPMLGYTPEEVIGTSLSQHCSPEEMARMAGMMAEALQSEDPVDGLLFETGLFHKNGKEIAVEIASNPLLDDGNLVGIQGTFRDITERKRVESERARLLVRIQEQVQQVQQIVATVPEGVLLLDAECQVLLANPAAERDLAVLASVGVGDTLTCLGDRPLAELLNSPPEALWHQVEAGSQSFEVIARPFEETAEPQGWVLVIRDVTESREVQQRILQQGRLAAVGEMAAGIAHDFNNIMAVIVLYTQMSLRMPDLLPVLKERMEVIWRQANAATDLIQQILDFGRRAVLDQRPMDLAPLLEEQVTLLRRTLPENISIDLACEREGLSVNADPTRIQQVVMNLAINARDAMPEGGELRFTLASITGADGGKCGTCGQAMEGEWVLLSVTDTGTGIAPDALAHLFEPFFTTKEVGKGTGLGMAQVYGIVMQHKGHIDVVTQLKEGTTLNIYLPALPESQPEAPAALTEDLVPGRGESILVVEDDAALREALVDTLELLDFRVLEAANGREALSILEGSVEEVAVVLSDLIMPQMGGKALFHAIRERGLGVPMVLLSGHPLEHELKDLREQGLAGWALKPPSMEELSQLLARALKAD